MAVIGTFGSYGTARLAIYAAQASMNVTGNNIGNINTTGYTRQRTDQCSMYSVGTPRYMNSFNMNIGYGAMVENVSQLRDPYLDIRYRNENASLGYYEAMQQGYNQLAHVLDEVGRGEDDFGMIEAKLGDFKNALRDLLQFPGSTQHDDLVSAAASTLCRLFNSAAKELKEVKENEENRMMEDVKDINETLDNIRDLNEQIRTQAIYGGNALELRDARNVQIDKLSKYMKINVVYSMEKIDGGIEIEKLSISLDSTKDPNTGKEYVLVDGVYATQFQTPETVPTPSPVYDPEITDGWQYAVYSGDPDNPQTNVATNDISKARVKNPMYRDPTKRYMSTGNGTPEYSNEPKAGYVVNPAYDYLYIAKDKTGVEINGKRYTNSADDADVVYSATYAPSNVAGYKYLAKAPTDFTPPIGTNDLNEPGKDYKIFSVTDQETKEVTYYTNNPDYALPMNNFKQDASDNLYLFGLDSLRDKDGRILNERSEFESKPVQLGDNDLFGSLQAMRELLTEEAEFASDADITLDPNAATKRGIPFYQHMLDSFAQKIADVFNEANHLPAASARDAYKKQAAAGGVAAANSPFVDKDGNVIKAVDKDGKATANNMTAADLTYRTELDPKDTNYLDPNTTDPDQLKQIEENKALVDANLKELWAKGEVDTSSEAWKHYDGGVLFSSNGNSDNPEGITAENLSISHSWAEGSVRVLNTTQPNSTYIDADGKEQYIDSKTLNDNIAHMMSLLDQKLEYTAKDTVADAKDTGKAFFKGTFQEMFGRGPALLGADTQTANALYSNFSITTLNLDNDRTSVSGVDLNEEATSMMQYSQSFSAACQLLTTIDEMLDKLINNTLR